jgi:hypothetical protein
MSSSNWAFASALDGCSVIRLGQQHHASTGITEDPLVRLIDAGLAAIIDHLH